LDVVGEINEELFVRGDETDYFYRCRIAGMRLGTLAQSLLLHPPDALRFNRLKYYYVFRNRVYLHRRYARQIYGGFTARFGILYILLRYSTKAPDHSIAYLADVFRAVRAAFRGRLIPYPGLTVGNVLPAPPRASGGGQG
jgi:GT2 family glycosyltransferase